MTDTLHPRVASLLREYARELEVTEPSSDLDARIGELVAGPRVARPPAARLSPRLRFAAAAGFALIAIITGIVIGVRLERHGAPPVGIADVLREPAWPPAEFSMWPTDSVALKVPAEYSSNGTLVAVDPKSQHSGTRYWVDIVVSNDGTVRIERILPAGGSPDGVTQQTH
jgi:hypothetical protein